MQALTYSCYQMYARMNTGISPEYVEFVAGQDFKVGPVAPHYLLRPEAVESFYILNFLTGDPIYREWGWEVFQSIEKYCKTNVAYGSIGNVQNKHSKPRDDMESFFLAGTPMLRGPTPFKLLKLSSPGHRFQSLSRNPQISLLVA